MTDFNAVGMASGILPTGPGSHSAQELRRRLALALLMKKAPMPKTFGEGLYSIGDSISDALMARSMGKQADADSAATDAQINRLMGGSAPSTYAPSDDVDTPPAVGAINRAIRPASAPLVAPLAQPKPLTMPVPLVGTPPEAQPPSTLFNPDNRAPGLNTPRQPPSMFDPRPMVPPPAPPPVQQGASALDGGYNFMDAQTRLGMKPTPGYMVDAITSREPNPEMQAYYGSLSGSEATNARDVSPTGAAGPFQFTRGTGRAYGVPGDRRFDPVASTDAVRAFTADNAATLENATGRPATFQNLALMHQQGPTGGVNLLQGRPTDPNNLAVNNIPPGSTPQAAVSRVNRFYGMPNEVAPVGTRDALAAATVAQQQPAAPPPDQRLAFNGAAPPAPAGLRAAIPAAPPPPSSTLQAAPDGEYVPRNRPRPEPPSKPTMGPLEQRLNREIMSRDVDPRLKAAAQTQIDAERAQRGAGYDNALKNYEIEKADWLKEKEQETKFLMDRQQQRATIGKTVAETKETNQKLIAPPEGGPAASGGRDPRLGTPESPQRVGYPEIPPPPPGAIPQKWAEDQGAKAAKSVEAVESAQPDFKEMLRVIKAAREHPGMKTGTGILGNAASSIPGTAAYEFATLLTQLKGKNFLAGYQKLKGTGQVSEIEGLKTEQAQSNVDPKAGEEALGRSLDSLENTIRSDLETLQRRVRRPVTAWQKDNEDRVAPDKGETERFSDGRVREYLGGDPRDIKGSWRIIQ